MLIFDLQTIGGKLHYFRKRSGMTQAEAAEAAGISERTYADAERGLLNMRIGTLLHICSALKITPDDVLASDEPDGFSEQAELIDRLNECSDADRETALRLLSVFINSLKE